MINTWIGIDPSLTSTGMTIIQDNVVKYWNFKSGFKRTKWHNRFDIKYIEFEPIIGVKTFSQGEILKLQIHDHVSDLIVGEILSITEPESCSIWLENFSYQSRVGPLIDLVSFSTALKLKLLHNRFSNLIVLAPSQLKSMAADIAYGKVGKGPSRNHDGLAGGKFKKSHMMTALFDANYSDQFIEVLKKERSQLENKLNLVKPIDDLVDSRWLAQLAKINTNI